LSNALTIGFDASANDQGGYAAQVFFRKPMLKHIQKHKFSWQLGLGSKQATNAQDWMVTAGISWGRGLNTQFGSGWAVLDLQTYYMISDDEFATKADFTVGLKPKEKLKIMLQIQSGVYPDSDPYVRLAPSISWTIKPGRTLEIGSQVGVVGDDRIGIKLGTWLEF